MLADAFSQIAIGFSQALGGPYHPAVAMWSGSPVFDDGGSIVAPGIPVNRDCLCQVDVVTEAMRADAGFVQGDVRLLVLTTSLDLPLNTDAMVRVAAGPGAGTYSIQSVTRDPIGVAWDMRGRAITVGGDQPIVRYLSGGITGDARLYAALRLELSLQGAIAATSSLNGAIGSGHALSGAVAGAGTVSATLSVGARLAGGIAGQGALSGLVTTESSAIALAGTVAGGGAVSAAIFVRAALAGSVVGSSGVTGAMTTAVPLIGTILAVGSTAADMTVTAAPAVPFSSINAVGWSGEYTATPGSLNPLTTFAVSRSGYTSTGTTTTLTDTLTATQRVRQMYPNQASLTALTVATSDLLLATDTISGVTNNSTLVMPKPIANWTMQSRRIVGNTVRLSVTGNHWAARNGKPFAAVEFTVTDGTTTVTAKVSAMTASTTGAGDVHTVYAYEADVDISTLANPAQITANAKVYPWVGGAASVADSSTGTGFREFSPRVFLRDTARFVNPNVIRVSTTGNNATAYAGSDPALAAASPAADATGAMNRARTVLGAGVPFTVQLTEGTWSLTSAPTANVTTTEIVIEPAPGALKANTIWNFGASNFNPGVTFLRYRGLKIVRAGAFYLFGGNTGFCVVEDCIFDTTASTGAIATTNNSVFFWNGVVMPAGIGQILASGNATHGMIRGVDVQSTAGNYHGKLVLGSRFAAAASYAAVNSSGGFFPEDNSIIQFSSFRAASPSNAVVQLVNTITGFSFSQNLIEVNHTTTSTPALRPSSDGNSNSLTHFLADNITLASGHFQVGRINGFYDETPSVYRLHTFCRVSRSPVGGYYHKGDVFLGTNGNGSPNPTDAPLHTGNRAQTYGVGFKGLVTLFAQAGTNTIGQSEGPAYGGLSSSIATSNTVPQISLADGVNFTAWRATTTNSGTGAAIAGAGGGDYTVPTGSALIGIIAAADEVFPGDLNGVARTRGTIGAYA